MHNVGRVFEVCNTFFNAHCVGLPFDSESPRFEGFFGEFRDLGFIVIKCHAVSIGTFSK